MTLNLMQVRAFVTVIDVGGFVDAAKKLDCAQPTVTQLIRKLESELGVSLLVRSRTGSTATAAGDRFLPHARRLLHAEARALASVANRTLTIGASGNVGTYLMPPVLRQFREKYGISADLVIATDPEVIEQLLAGAVDIAVVEKWDERSGFSATVWRREPLVVIVSPDHPWANDKQIPREWLLEAAMIDGEYGSSANELLQVVHGKDAAKITMSMNLGSTAAVKEAVKAGLGISLVMLSSVRDEIRAGTLCALQLDGETISKELIVVNPDGVPDTTPSSIFRSQLLENAI